VEGGAFRNAIERAELVEGEAKGDENFEVEFGERLGRGLGDFGIEARAPAEDSHDEFHGEGVILGGEAVVDVGVQEFAGIGGIAFDAQQNVEGGGASGGERHGWDCTKMLTAGDRVDTHHRGHRGTQRKTRQRTGEHTRKIHAGCARGTHEDVCFYTRR
jgi:hypothetical protein